MGTSPFARLPGKLPAYLPKIQQQGSFNRLHAPTYSNPHPAGMEYDTKTRTNETPLS